jgi:hypothetical protein
LPAQPASHVKWNGNYFFGSDVLINLPDHGCLVAAVIAGWAATETNLGRMFAELIGAKQPVTLSMYAAARSFEVQRDLLQAAVDEILPKRYATLFKAALVVLNRAAKQRHNFAHWIWGASADPGLQALLLVEPKHFWNLAAEDIRFWKRISKKAPTARENPMPFILNPPKLDHKHIVVYRLKDLREVHEQIEQAFRIADAFRQIVDAKDSRRHAIYKWINSEPQIHSEIAKTKAKTNPGSKR